MVASSALTTNVGQGRKCFQLYNTLAYHTNVKITTSKVSQGVYAKSLSYPQMVDKDENVFNSKTH